MDIKCIALDLDRTTLNEHARLSDGNREALEYAISKGVHIVIASGRGFDSLPEDVLSIPGIEYAITSNGASVYHNPSGKRLMSYTLTPRSVQEILALTAGHHVAYEAFIDGIAYAQEDYVEHPDLYGAANAALLCAQIIAVEDKELAAKLDAKRQADAAKVLEKDRTIAANL